MVIRIVKRFLTRWWESVLFLWYTLRGDIKNIDRFLGQASSEDLEKRISMTVGELDLLRKSALDALARERQQTLEEINALSRQISELDRWLGEAEERANRLYDLEQVARWEPYG
jgi:hypothetical protein